MLSFYDVLWVIPGVIFIFLYNRRRPEAAINLLGWPYVFFLVFIASLTWMPAELAITCSFPDLSDHLQKIATLFVASCLSLIFSLCMRLRFIQSRLPLVHDDFYRNCIEWKDEVVFLVLKNGKAYVGVLWRYPKDPRLSPDLQTISIIPIKSGYRRKDDMQIVWNVEYPSYTTKEGLKEMAVLMPRNEVVNYGKFSEETFNHFLHKNN